MLRLQEIERRHWAGAGRRGEGALLQLPTDGVVHEDVGAGVPVGGIREAGEEEGGQEGNSGFFVVTKRKIMINLMGCGQRLLGLLFQQDSSKQNAFLMFCLQEKEAVSTLQPVGCRVHRNPRENQTTLAFI